MLVIRFPKTKLIGKKAKTRFVNKIESIEKFFLFKFVTLLTFAGFKNKI